MSNKADIPGFELLQINHAGKILTKDGETINYGVIRLTDDELVYYTGKGLSEMWKENMTDKKKDAEVLIKIGEEENGEQKLISSGHIAITKMENIAKVLY